MPINRRACRPVTFVLRGVSAPRNSATNRSRRAGNDMPPQALNDPDMALVDLFGDGLPDVLHSGPAGFRYWRNLGDGRWIDPGRCPRFRPASRSSQPGVGFGDMGGDGQADLLVHSRSTRRVSSKPRSTAPGRRSSPYDVVSQFRSGRSERATGRSHRRRPIRCADEREISISCGLNAWANRGSRAPQRSRAATTSTPSRMCSSTIPPDGSAWPT